MRITGKGRIAEAVCLCYAELIPHRRGEVSERLKEPASKAGSLAKPGSWVRIPPSPPCTAWSVAPPLSNPSFSLPQAPSDHFLKLGSR